MRCASVVRGLGRPTQLLFIFPSSVLCPESEDPRAGAEGSTCAQASLLLSRELCPRGTSQSLTSAWPWPWPSCCHFFPQRPVIAGSVLGFSEPVFPAGRGPAHPAPSARLEKVTEELTGAPVPAQPPGATPVLPLPSLLEFLFFEAQLRHCPLNSPQRTAHPACSPCVISDITNMCQTCLTPCPHDGEARKSSLSELSSLPSSPWTSSLTSGPCAQTETSPKGPMGCQHG